MTKSCMPSQVFNGFKTFFFLFVLHFQSINSRHFVFEHMRINLPRGSHQYSTKVYVWKVENSHKVKIYMYKHEKHPNGAHGFVQQLVKVTQNVLDFFF